MSAQQGTGRWGERGGGDTFSPSTAGQRLRHGHSSLAVEWCGEASRKNMNLNWACKEDRVEVYEVEGQGIGGREAGTSKGLRDTGSLRQQGWCEGPARAEQKSGEREQRERLESTRESWGYPWEPGVRGQPFRILRQPSVRVVTGVYQNRQASLKCTWDSSSSNESSLEYGARRHPAAFDQTVEGRVSVCQTEVSSTLLSIPRVMVTYRRTKPIASGPIFLSVCLNTLAGPPPNREELSPKLYQPKRHSCAGSYQPPIAV